MKHVVFLPGIAADERIFGLLELHDCTKQFIKWNKPEKRQSFSSYLRNVEEQIKTSEPVVLIGQSLGGIMAMELRELIPVEKTILISSVKCKSEMPSSFEWIRRTKLNEMIPVSIIKKSAPIIKPMIEDTSNEDAWNRFKGMLKDSDNDFMKSAFRYALEWDRTEYKNENLVHIHGTNDKVFPLKNILSCDYIIKDGSHDMVMTRAEDISKILNKVIFLS